MTNGNKADKLVKRFVLYSIAAVIVIVIGLTAIGIIGIFSN